MEDPLRQGAVQSDQYLRAGGCTRNPNWALPQRAHVPRPPLVYISAWRRISRSKIVECEGAVYFYYYSRVLRIL